MRATTRHAAVPVALLLAVGCTSHVYYPGAEHPHPVSGRPPITAFDYGEPAGALTLLPPSGRRAGYSSHRFIMPASFENGQPGNRMTGTYYASLVPGKRPLVIVLPVWGVSEYPSVKMARAILKRSRGRLNVLRVDGRNRLIDWKRIEQATTLEEFTSGVTNSADRLKHAVIDARRLIDWAATRDEIDQDRVGLVGFSISAVTGTLVVQSDSRVRASALVMGGAQIGRIVSECPGNEEQTRKGIIDKLGLSLGEYERTISARFEGLDPADYPNRVDPGSVLIVDAAKDECIPEESREAWWEALGRPERISMNYAHRGAFMAMTPVGFNFLRSRIYDHLEKSL